MVPTFYKHSLILGGENHHCPHFSQEKNESSEKFNDLPTRTRSKSIEVPRYTPGNVTQSPCSYLETVGTCAKAVE